MSLPNVNITLADGQLGGLVATTDGITGLVLTGISETSGVTAGSPFSVTSLTDAQNKGFSAANNPFAYKQVQEFYNEAPIGTLLYLLLVPNTIKVSDMADKTNANGAIKLLNYAAGTIRVLGLATDDTAVYTGSVTLTQTNGINADCYTAATNLLSMASDFFTEQKPFRGVVGGTSYNGSANNLTDFSASLTNNRVSILIGDTVSGAGAAVGLLLGRIAAIPVQRKVSRVKTGALSATAAYIGATDAAISADATVIDSRRYITFRTFPNVSGYYFTGDTTLISNADDYSSLARGRVIDKAQTIAYATFVNEVDDEVPVNADGTLSPGYTKYLEQQIINQINLSMTANREVSGVDCFVDPAQNVLSTNQVNVVLKVTPVGYASEIQVQLGFENPALQ